MHQALYEFFFMSIFKRAGKALNFRLNFHNIYCRIPIWPYAKLILTCWLVLPYFTGAAYVYEHYVRPFLANPQTINIWYVPRKKDVFTKQDDIITAAEKYIKENGTEAFENLIHRVFTSATLGYYRIIMFWLCCTNCAITLQADKSKWGSSHHTMYDETYWMQSCSFCLLWIRGFVYMLACYWFSLCFPRRYLSFLSPFPFCRVTIIGLVIYVVFNGYDLWHMIYR